VIVACDVGQGDALVLNAGRGSAVVVDAGPDPRVMDRCLDRLGVRSVPLLLLSHFHADHVDGIDGVFNGRTVADVQTARLLVPSRGVAVVNEAAERAGLTPHPAVYGRAVQYGAATIEVLWPLPDSPSMGPSDGLTVDIASVVLLVEVDGLRLLLTGDAEPENEMALAAALPGLQVDVLKMPHHGSRFQDEPWLVSLHAKVVLVSVGAHNSYGHPAQSALEPLSAGGAEVVRTDQDGDLAVVADGDAPRVVTNG
jgi:competence protein ComEC